MTSFGIKNKVAYVKQQLILLCLLKKYLPTPLMVLSEIESQQFTAVKLWYMAFIIIIIIIPRFDLRARH